MGKVPAIRHRGQVVTECAAICAYLADAFPEAGLAPTPAERAGYYRWLFFAAGPVEAAVTAHAMGAEPQDERQQGMARSEERRVGKEWSVRVDLGGRRIIKKKTIRDSHCNAKDINLISNNSQTTKHTRN